MSATMLRAETVLALRQMLRVARAHQADAETTLCLALTDWVRSRGACARRYHRANVARAVLACRMARGAVAQARLAITHPAPEAGL